MVRLLAFLLFFSPSVWAQEVDSVEVADSISILGVGDIMMGTNFPDDSYLPPSGANSLLQHVMDVVQGADISFGNLEGVLLDNEGEPKTCKNPDICYLFRSPTAYAANLKSAGFDLLSTANNHVNDFGLEGRKSTAETLNQYELNFAGFVDKPSIIIEKNGLKIGFAAFAPNQGTASIFQLEKARKIVSDLDSICNIVIVSVHNGGEGKEFQHVTRESENYLGVNRGNIYEFSRHMIDAGADVLFGHGPHVTRAVDLYKDRFIAYSLGNFCTYRRFNLSGVSGYAPIIKVFTNSEGKFLSAEVISIKQTPPGGPAIDSGQNAFYLIEKLTKEDLPEATLDFQSPFIFPKKD